MSRLINKQIIFTFISIILILFIASGLSALSENSNNYKLLDFLKQPNNCSNIDYTISNRTMNLHMDYIGFGSYYCIKDGLKKIDHLIIDRNSGGLLHESFLISKAVQDNNISVHVNNTCYSACTNILFSSYLSTINSNARIGSHQSNIQQYKIFKPINSMIDSIKKQLLTNNNRNFNINFYQSIINSTPYEDIYIYQHSDLLKNGMINKIANHSITLNKNNH